MARFDPYAVVLSDDPPRYDAEREAVRLSARVGVRDVAIVVSAEAVEDLMRASALSTARILEGAERHRVTLRRAAEDKARETGIPDDGTILLTGRDMPRPSGF